MGINVSSYVHLCKQSLAVILVTPNIVEESIGGISRKIYMENEGCLSSFIIIL